MTSRSPTETARYLIQHAGGVGAAHDAVTATAKEMKRPRGQPERRDGALLFVAVAIQRRDECSTGKALEQAARLALDESKVESTVRRLRAKLGGRSLEEFAGTCPSWLIPSLRAEAPEERKSGLWFWLGE
jgi:hypothetical protein